MPQVNTRKILITFPTSWDMGAARELINQYNPDTVQAGIVNNRPIIYATRQDKFTFSIGRYKKQGITFETANFQIPVFAESKRQGPSMSSISLNKDPESVAKLVSESSEYPLFIKQMEQLLSNASSNDIPSKKYAQIMGNRIICSFELHTPDAVSDNRTIRASCYVMVPFEGSFALYPLWKDMIEV